MAPIIVAVVKSARRGVGNMGLLQGQSNGCKRESKWERGQEREDEKGNNGEPTSHH